MIQNTVDPPERKYARGKYGVRVEYRGVINPRRVVVLTIFTVCGLEEAAVPLSPGEISDLKAQLDSALAFTKKPVA